MVAMATNQLFGMAMIMLFAKLSLCQADGHELMATNFTNIAYSMCPLHGFCQRKLHNDTDVAQESCCSPCSCDKDCSIGQTCCPDADVDLFGSVRLRCRHQDDHFNFHRNVYLMLSDKYPRFYVTDTCKEGFLDEDVISGCHSPKTLREHVYVTDPSSTLIYKNEKCAVCNDVKEYIQWDLRVLCPFKYDLYRADRMNTYLLEECSFASEPPSTLTSLSDIWKCPYNMISTCNVSRQWDQYDPVFEEGCKRFNTPYLGETILDISGQLRPYRSLFQNVYCYLCNTNPTTRGSRECNAWTLDNASDRDVLNENFSALLDITAVESIGSVEDDEEGRCRIDEIEDPLTKTCVVMLCPFGEATIKGKCTSQMRQISGCLSATFSFIYTPSNQTPLSSETVENLFGVIHDLSVRRFALKSCQYRSIFLFSNDVILLDAATSRECPLNILLEVFRHLQRSYRIMINGEPVVVHVWLTSHLRGDLFASGVSEVKKSSPGNCVIVAVLTPKFYCKRITISLNALSAHGISNTTVSQIAEYSEPVYYVHGVPKRHVICLHDYMRIVSRGVKPSMMLSVFVATLQVIVILVSTETA